MRYLNTQIDLAIKAGNRRPYPTSQNRKCHKQI